jgi:hypothetical protein
MTKTFIIYSCYWHDDGYYDYNIHSKIVLTADDFYDEFFFDNEEHFDEPSKHNRVSRILTNDAIKKYNLDDNMYIQFY